MTVIIASTVYCPLCEKPMTQRKVQYKTKITNLYFCQPCYVGIYDFDPAFNKWRDAEKNIPCPACGHPKIKWFARHIDGFFKGKCPKCKTVLAKDGDVQFKKNGAIVIPDEMEQDPIEEPITVHIPLTHFIKRLGKDKVNAIRQKLRLGRQA